MIKTSPRLPACLSCVVFAAVVLLGSAQVCAAPPGNGTQRIKVFVSILPQAYFVERVGGNRVHVSVMVGPGHSPATYEPMPMQMGELSKADVYFSIGVPFEKVWMGRLSGVNPRMKVIDTGRGIELLPMELHDHGADKPYRDHDQTRLHQHRAEGLKDPHIWLSLRLAKIQARNICDGLIAQDPSHRTYYEDNLGAFHSELDELDKQIKDMLKDLRTRKFMIFHPALGYFARDYGLEQLPIETEGKEPSAKTLAGLIEHARDQGVRVIFVQKQFSTASAEAVARAIGGRVARVDPLASDYLNNMREIAETFAGVMQ
jgi:zinc transport system substrate-binding protein